MTKLNDAKDKAGKKESPSDDSKNEHEVAKSDFEKTCIEIYFSTFHP